MQYKNYEIRHDDITLITDRWSILVFDRNELKQIKIHGYFDKDDKVRNKASAIKMICGMIDKKEL